MQKGGYTLGRVRWGCLNKWGLGGMMLVYLVNVIELLDALCFGEGFEA